MSTSSIPDAFLESLHPDTFNGRHRDTRAKDWLVYFERYCNAAHIGPRVHPDGMINSVRLLKAPSTAKDLRPVKFSSTNSASASWVLLTPRTPSTRSEICDKNDPTTSTLSYSRGTVAASKISTTPTPCAFSMVASSPSSVDSSIAISILIVMISTAWSRLLNV